jgi:transposase
LLGDLLKHIDGNVKPRVNRPGFELTPRSWTNFKGFHEEVPNRLHGIDGLRPKRSAYSVQFKLQVLSHQDREQLSSRQVAAVYDIRDPNQVVVWRRNLDEGGVEALGNRKQGRPTMKPERRCPAPPSTAITDSAQALREENERLRAEVAYLKKLQALIRSKRSAVLRPRAKFAGQPQRSSAG